MSRRRICRPFVFSVPIDDVWVRFDVWGQRPVDARRRQQVAAELRRVERRAVRQAIEHEGLYRRELGR